MNYTYKGGGYMVRVRINTSQVNRAIRDLNREVDKKVRREVQKLERELKRKLK